MKTDWRRALALLAPLAFAASLVPARAAAPGEDPCLTIKEVKVRGNMKMSADAVRFDLAVKAGAKWDDAALHREYVRLWKRGYFADLRFLRQCDPDGAVLIVELKERPTIIAVSYDKISEVSQTQIEDYFKERSFTLTVGSPLDRKKLWRAQTLITEVLAQKGYMDAQVTAETKDSGPNTRAVHFRIRPGGKTRIRKLDFVGNKAFSSRTLRKQLKLIRPWRWWWPWSSKYLYHPLKYQQDINNVVQFYKDSGRLDADVKPPVVVVRPIHPEKAEAEAKKRAEKEARKQQKEREKQAKTAGGEAFPLAAATPPASPPPELKVKKWVYITVPVEEGPVYRLGEIKFEGNAVFDSKLLRAMMPLRDGTVVSDGALETGLKYIREIYGVKGYVYATTTRSFERKEGQPVADVVVVVDEDQPYTVRRIDFRGNTVTNDEVLRREMNVYEGELLNKAQLDRSIQKLQMLGFWMPAEEPTLQPRSDRAEVDVVVQGEEQNRNQIQVGGGYSELEGGFFLTSFETSNFLGRGERLSLYVAVGGRANSASISFTEPWFMGKPYTVGFQLFRRSYDFGVGTDLQGATQRLSQTSTGGALIGGKRLTDFSQIQVSYSYESIKADTIDLSQQFTATRTRLATLNPIYSYRKINSPLRPTKGFEFTLGPRIAAKAFGGDSNYLEPTVSTSAYHPVFRRLFVGGHLMGGYIRPFGEVQRIPGFIDGVPRFERFFLGGDTIGPRIFESRTLSPIRLIAAVDQFGNPILDSFGNPILVPAYVGGNKEVLGQFELGAPLGKTATLAGFFDAGGVYDNGENVNTRTMRMSAGVEFRIFIPAFQAPIRLIYGWPLRQQPGDRTSRFQFSIGLPF